MVRLLTVLLLLATSLAAQDRDTLNLELVLDERDATPLVGEMVLGTLRGIYRETIANEDLKLRDMTDFDWARLGQDDWSKQRIDGRTTLVFERRIAFFPKRSGTLEILPIAHELEIQGASGQREIVLVRSAPVRIEVGEKPAGAGDAWLPVRALEISETWSADAARLEDGQSVTRRVVLRALGATPEMMPEQPPLREPWLITFTPPAERDFQVTTHGPVTTLVWSWSLRPITGEPGVIPEVSIPYFDTEERMPRTVTMPAVPIGYASFEDNAASGWRNDPGIGRGHLGIMTGIALLVVALAMRGRLGPASVLLQLRMQLHQRKELKRLKRYAENGDAARFRMLAQCLLQPFGPTQEPHQSVRQVDKELFGGDQRSGTADLRSIFRDVRHTILSRNNGS